MLVFERVGAISFTSQPLLEGLITVLGQRLGHSPHNGGRQLYVGGHRWARAAVGTSRLTAAARTCMLAAIDSSEMAEKIRAVVEGVDGALQRGRLYRTKG